MVTRVSFDQSSGSFADHEEVAFNAATPAVAFPSTPTSKVIEGAISVTGRDGEARTVARGSYSFPIAGTAGDSVASTLQRRYGPPSVELEPGNPSSRTSVEVAAAMGVIRRDEAGNWVDAGTTDEQAQALQRELNPPQEEQQPDPLQVFDQAQAVAFADAIGPIPQHAFDVAQAHALAGVFEGQSFSQAVAEVSQRLAQDAGGMEPSQVAAVVRQGFDLYEAAVAKAAAAEGVSEAQKQAFYASLREGSQSGLQDALSRLVYGNDISGFRALARNFSNANPSPTVQALQAGGFEVARTADGWMARRGSGQWVSVAELAKHAEAGAPAAPAPVSPSKAPAQAPAGKTKVYFDPVTWEYSLTEAEARRDGVDLSRFKWV